MRKEQMKKAQEEQKETGALFENSEVKHESFIPFVKVSGE
jgi:hypothetical protein